MKPFFTEEGKPQLKESYCVYMDVLGFNQLILDSHKNKTSQALLERFHEKVSKSVKSLMEVPIKDIEPWWGVKVFTDNIVMGYPLFTPDGESEFGFMLMGVSEYQ